MSGSLFSRADLTLPLVNLPIERGLLSHSFLRRRDPKCLEVQLGIPKPTSGHQQVTRSRCPEVALGILDFIFHTIAKRQILIRPLDTFKKNERSRCPEVGLGILDFIIRRSVEHMKSMQDSLVFLAFLTHQEIPAISTHTTVNGTGARSTLRKFT